MLTQIVAGRVWDYSHAVGGRYGIQFPVAVAIGSEDFVYILCRTQEAFSAVPWNRTGVDSTVVKLTIGMLPGDEEFALSCGGYGDEPGKMIWTAGIALDSRENVYATDEWMNRVSVFDKEGSLQGIWGTTGSEEGELLRPSGIAVDAQEDVYIADSLNHRIQKFTKEGKFLAKWGSRGNGEGELDSPWGITIDAQGCVYVADHKNHRAQKFTPDGEWVATFGSYGSGRGQLDRPSDVAVDPDGDVYVCDWANSRVQVYGPEGKFITSFIGDAQQLAKWHQETVDANQDVIKARRRVKSLEPEWRFALPTGVTFDPRKGRLFVADTQRGRLQIYNKLKDFAEAQANL